MGSQKSFQTQPNAIKVLLKPIQNFIWAQSNWTRPNKLQPLKSNPPTPTSTPLIFSTPASQVKVSPSQKTSYFLESSSHPHHFINYM